jgi:hypothetical protein
VIAAHAQSCPNCPIPPDPDNCGPPDCNDPEKIRLPHALYPHPDPNYYWQCAPNQEGRGWIAIARPCACGTVFNPFVYPRRCTFYFDDNWQPICNWQNPPTLRRCDPWCPDCNGQNTPPTVGTPSPITTTTFETPPTTRPTEPATTTTPNLPGGDDSNTTQGPPQ